MKKLQDPLTHTSYFIFLTQTDTHTHMYIIRIVKAVINIMRNIYEREREKVT